MDGEHRLRFYWRYIHDEAPPTKKTKRRLRVLEKDLMDHNISNWKTLALDRENLIRESSMKLTRLQTCIHCADYNYPLYPGKEHYNHPNVPSRPLTLHTEAAIVQSGSPC